MEDIKGRTYYQISKDRVSNKLNIITTRENNISEIREKITSVTESVKTYAACSALAFIVTMSLLITKDFFLALAASCMLCGIGGGLLFGITKFTGWVVGDKILSSIQDKLNDHKYRLSGELKEASKKLLTFDKNSETPSVSETVKNRDTATSSFINSLLNKHGR